MEQIPWTQVLINRLLGKPAVAILAALHIQPGNAKYPIPNYDAMLIIVLAIMVVFFLWLKSRLSVDRPGVTQQLMEGLLTNPLDLGVYDMLQDNVGHGFEKYVPMIGSIGIFILFANLISIIPTLASPTAETAVPFGCAVLVFIYYNWCGLQKNGPFGYLKHFMGPVPAVGPLVFVIEIFSHLARMLSLTVRLWVNMLVSELLYGIFLSLMLGFFLFLGKVTAIGYVSAPMPLLIPVLFLALHLFVALVQAFVFTILPVIYVAGAVAEEH